MGYIIFGWRFPPGTCPVPPQPSRACPPQPKRREVQPDPTLPTLPISLQTGKFQCCQLWAKPASQSGGKIWPLKKIRPSAKFDFLKASGLMKILLVVSTCLGKVQYFFDLHRIRENKRRKTIFLEVRPIFGPFCTKSAKIRSHLCPAFLFFYSAFFELCGRTIGQLATLINVVLHCLDAGSFQLPSFSHVLTECKIPFSEMVILTDF